MFKRYKTIHKNEIVLITGTMGAGKTLLLTLLGAMEKQHNPELTIVANYRTVFAEYSEKAQNMYRRKNALLLFDEGTTELDSRNWMHNNLSTQLIQRMRKRNLTLIIAVQDISFIDKRIRKIFHKHLAVSFNENYQLLYVKNETNMTSFTIQVTEHMFDLYDTNEEVKSKYNEAAVDKKKQIRDEENKKKQHLNYIDNETRMFG